MVQDVVILYPGPMKKEETIDFNIRTAWLTISRMYNQQAQQFDTTMSEGYVLLNIDSETGTRPTQLAPLLGMESTSLSRILRNLENKGLIERTPDPVDGRAVVLSLSAEGLKSQEMVKQTVRHFNNSIRSQVNEKELSTFFKVIAKINDIIETKNIFENISYEQEQVN